MISREAKNAVATIVSYVTTHNAIARLVELDGSYRKAADLVFDIESENLHVEVVEKHRMEHDTHFGPMSLVDVVPFLNRHYEGHTLAVETVTVDHTHEVV